VFIAGFPAGSFQANCYVIGTARSSEAIVVDPGEGAGDRLAEVLAEQDLRAVAVLLTHGHLDHMASAAAICDGAGIPAYLHDADSYMLDDPLAGMSPQIRQALSGSNLVVTGLRPAEVISLTEVAELDIAGLKISVDHTPGHTGGSVVFRFAGTPDSPEVLLTGDTLFAGSVGRTDLPGGSTEQLMVSIRSSLLTRADSAVVLPGHGPTSTIGDERRSNPYLR